ncbi:MAG TPA: LTA synthase family protein [Phycisphaerae bacterium]|nr:LTA synthase family protein [Phycisphaerae bacterium]HOJ73741.1 LTA synthase family protein [Phycisphaerae bacterium]HOM50388.1 LTA synthase family protein [Phycisphaerae bacterium]HON67705.1 LTA synthase family protein [Phycisphaerae bacterium]HOQ84200.1 LTA synthase family protein [Phycisphaerae bacterium]
MAIVWLSLCALLLLVPKLMLVAYMNEFLWANFGLASVLLVLTQDVALSLAVTAFLILVLHKPTLPRLGIAYAATAGLLALLLLDARVRQLWLQPTSLDLIRYSWKFAPDLTSGVDMFFKFPSGLAASFRKWFVYVMAIQFVCFMPAAVFLRRRFRCPTAPRLRARHAAGILAGLSILAALASVRIPSHMYSAEKNIITAGILDLWRAPAALGSEEAAEACDQQLHPPPSPSSRPAGEPSRRPFKNLALFMLESVRWKGLNLRGAEPTVTPTLRRLAIQGTLARCYVSVPHSSKALFATLTGWYACSGVEILEGTRLRTPSVIWSLREQRGARTYCFSVQNLLFENTNGILMSCGVETRFGPHELRRLVGDVDGPRSSFGDSDELLVEAVTRVIPRDNVPFAAVIITLAAHHPYDYPDKPAGVPATVEHYWKSVAYLDQTIDRILQNLSDAGLLDDTLVVLVGDHGESFGEHGTFIHNNSLYEEEITVPLILWSADGRLTCEETLVARQIDIAPTVADLMNVHDARHLRQGTSLFDPHGDRTIYVSSFFDDFCLGLIDGDEKFIWYPAEDRLQHFNLRTDPAETQDLPVDPALSQTVKNRLTALSAYQKRALR